jgi:hypothetical protein
MNLNKFFSTKIIAMSSTRQLAAITFTDIAGYTSLMGNDDEILSKNRQLQKPLIEHYNGKEHCAASLI